MQNWVIYLLVGLLIGTAGGFTGLGGGFILVPILLFMGFEAQRAVGTSFAVILMISISALVAHSKLQNVDYKLGILLGLGGIMGAQIGARLVEMVPTATFKRIFAIILVLIALRIFFQK
ncbi:MAG: sulfite exporter TauE/SafE family protein [Deltaproteobacteria bacterium]|nr:MAG: sulfite exporter TauE/SafE family protein [Deltaproteobacteria bacterium]